MLKYNNYSASIHFSIEDEVFYGKILGISGLVTFEAATKDELNQAFKDAVDDYMQTIDELGPSTDI